MPVPSEPHDVELLAVASVAALILLYGLFSARLESTVVSGPMVFVGAGLLLGSMGFDILDLSIRSPVVHRLAEATLILILFVDASRIDLGMLRREHDIPIRLLAIGLPLTIAAGALAGVAILPVLTLVEAILLAVILAPTDAALGLPVVTNRSIPVRIRQALNVESGLNDGIALPFLLFFVSMGIMSEGHERTHWVLFALGQITLGPLAGFTVGLAGGKLVGACVSRGWMSGTFQRLSVLALSLLAYASAELVGGNGFIAAFAAGMTVGNFSSTICGRLHEFGEAEGQLLLLLIFLIFGAAMVPVAAGSFDLSVFLYGLVSLTLVRMVPVALSLAGLGLRWSTTIFLGWFGPRGLASIIYGLLVLEETGAVSTTLFAVMVMTVLLSVYLHGITAWPVSRWYGRHAESMRGEPDLPEMREVPEMPARMGYRG